MDEGLFLRGMRGNIFGPWYSLKKIDSSEETGVCQCGFQVFIGIFLSLAYAALYTHTQPPMIC